MGLRGEAAQRGAQASALSALQENRGNGSRCKWWSFEGFTEVDCCFQTDRMALLIEGKRTESLSDSTAWYGGRNQLHRNLEAARDLAGRREFGVVVIGEETLPASALGNPDAGLPHLNPTEREELLTHYLGCLTWRQVCEATGVGFDELPDNVRRPVKPRPDDEGR